MINVSIIMSFRNYRTLSKTKRQKSSSQRWAGTSKLDESFKNFKYTCFTDEEKSHIIDKLKTSNKKLNDAIFSEKFEVDLGRKGIYSAVYEDYVSNGLYSLGPEKVIKYLHEINNLFDAKLPIVSIGSGSGFIEWLAGQYHSELNFICVDPDPMMFYHGHKINELSKIFVEPEYPYVNKLLNDRPNIVGNCILFLNWTLPYEENEFCNSEYDYEALQKLNPCAVISITSKKTYEYVAGGKSFHSWLKDEDTKLSHKYATYKSLSGTKRFSCPVSLDIKIRSDYCHLINVPIVEVSSIK